MQPPVRRSWPPVLLLAPLLLLSPPAPALVSATLLNLDTLEDLGWLHGLDGAAAAEVGGQLSPDNVTPARVCRGYNFNTDQCAGRLAEMQRILRQLMMNKRRLYVNKRSQ